MKRVLALVIALTICAGVQAADAPAPLLVGLAAEDITPKLGGKPVYMAGFGQNRKATGVHDPLAARAIVFKHGAQKIALVSVDLVGFFHTNVLEVRKQLSDFTYALVSSTHNHEGPDTLGLWGPSPFASGVDLAYLRRVEEQINKAVRAAERAAKPVTARLGTAAAPELLHDGREPYIKHDELVAIQFLDADSKKPVGLLVQWNNHPETLGSKNTELSADYVGLTVAYLQKRQQCPVIYFTGTVGGLMTSLHVEIKDEQGRVLPEESMEKTVRYSELVGQVAERAVASAQPIDLAPLQAQSRDVFIPLTNKFYQVGRQLGVLRRPAYLWTGDAAKAEPADAKVHDKPLCMRTEVAWLRLGDLDVACIPGEIYPELVLDKVQDPQDPAADFPNAPIEPAIYKQLRRPRRMIIGLANDEIGYIIPKRQWDEQAPFCYGRTKTQYGEINSVGPETAPLVCEAFRKLVRGEK